MISSIYDKFKKELSVGDTVELLADTQWPIRVQKGDKMVINTIDRAKKKIWLNLKSIDCGLVGGYGWCDPKDFKKV